MKKKFLLIFSVFYLSFALWSVIAEEKGKDASIDPVKGSPVYLMAEFHENEGCPINSLCDKETGQFRKKWLELVFSLNSRSPRERIEALEHFREKNGLPSELLVLPGIEKEMTPILWDSPCGDLTRRGVQMGEAFIKDTKNHKFNMVIKGKEKIYSANEKLQLTPILLSQVSQVTQVSPTPPKSMNVKVYLIPQGEIPIYLEKSKIQLIRDAEGIYYLLQISSVGEWTVRSVPQASGSPSEVVCPPELLKYFEEKFNTNSNHLYIKFYCRRIIDRSSKEDFIMLIPQSC